MIPRKLRQHLDEHFKNQVAGKKSGKYALQMEFWNKKGEHISISCEENWTKVCIQRHIKQESSFWSPQSCHNKGGPQA